MSTLVWFRLDLRLSDQPALHWAIQRKGPVIPVFIWAPEEEGTWAPGAATRWWLHHSLVELQKHLEKLGSRLILRKGPTLQTLRKLLEETGATGVVWNRRYEPAVIQRDTQIKSALKGAGVEVESFNGSLLYEPWEIQNKSKRPFQVFTPFSKACLALREPDAPLTTPLRLPAPHDWPASDPLDRWKLLPRIPWDKGMQETWQPGATGAHALLRSFLKSGVTEYTEARDLPAQRGTSRLSPHLHFGEISPREIWQTVCDHLHEPPQQPQAGYPYLRQLLWREFGHHLLYHFPHTPDQPLREEFAEFPWADDWTTLRKWEQGQTGYPIVDAGLRELWTTGWMHNRVRMIAASFLVKDLLLPWQQGARWFWDTLVDADLPNNTLGWQWTAGCGADAAPYFRIFNPVTQSEKFDPDGVYLRRWVPEIANLPNKYLHAPWTAPAAVLQQAGVELGTTYPQPIVDHSAARDAALEAFHQLLKST